MKRISERDLIRTVAERFAVNAHRITTFDGKAVLDRLRQLDVETATVEEVDTIISVKGWVSPTCSCCGKRVAVVVELDVTGGEYETLLCADCVIEALTTIVDTPQ